MKVSQEEPLHQGQNDEATRLHPAQIALAKVLGRLLTEQISRESEVSRPASKDLTLNPGNSTDI